MAPSTFPNCPHFFQTRKTDGCCRIGRFGGEGISFGTCASCIRKGENTEAFAVSKPMRVVAHVIDPATGERCKTCKPIVPL